MSTTTAELSFAAEKNDFLAKKRAEISKRLQANYPAEHAYLTKIFTFEKLFPPGSASLQEILDGTLTVPEEARIEVVEAVMTRADRGQVETLNGWTRGYHTPLFTLAEANQIFKYAEEHPEREDLEFFRGLKKWFDDIIEASEGQMVWSKSEKQRRLNLLTITGNYLEIPQKVIELTRECVTWTRTQGGFGRQEHAYALAWFTPSTRTGCPIKPEKRYYFPSNLLILSSRLLAQIARPWMPASEMPMASC